VPFEALLTDPQASRNRSVSELPYLLRSHVVSYVPSASVLAQFRTPRPHPPGPSGKSLLAFAPWSSLSNPPATHTVALRAANTAAMAPLPALPESGKEVSRIAALYPAPDVRVYLDQAASEQSVRANPLLAAAHRIHFATHGVISEQQPLLSGLALAPEDGESDGVLRSHEIFDLDLSADLVVLSACETGLGMRLSGEGIVGLARAFFYAGASSLVVSLWNVADVSTSDLMTAFYRRLPPGADDADKAEALRQAKLDLIAGGGQHAHPFHWSPFVLVGDPR
jgi:CHAT domain-containing protein